MRFLSILLLSTMLLHDLVSCQTKASVKTVFISTQNDTATALNETKIYRLKKQTINSDFNNSKLDDIDANIGDTLNQKSIRSIFEPVNGHYKYYQFISTFKGLVCCDGEGLKDYHDILIIKTNEENEILDAYQYTLEWAELPLQYDLYENTVQGLTLSDKMDIADLKFKRTSYWNDKDKMLKEHAILRLE